MLFYSFELQMAGVILLTAMFAGGISLWLKRRRERQTELTENEEAQKSAITHDNSQSTSNT